MSTSATSQPTGHPTPIFVVETRGVAKKPTAIAVRDWDTVVEHLKMFETATSMQITYHTRINAWMQDRVARLKPDHDAIPFESAGQAIRVKHLPTQTTRGFTIRIRHIVERTSDRAPVRYTAPTLEITGTPSFPEA